MNGKKQNEVKVSFPSLSVNERFARLTAAGFAAALDPTVDELSDIKTAVSEAVTNAIVHGYRDRVGTVTLTCRQLEGGILVFIVTDRGCGIGDVGQAMTPCFTTAPSEERSGLGFTVMQTFMDKLRVRSTPGKGTRVTMTKCIRGRER